MKPRAHRKRLQQIVDYVFDGNVKAAAEAAGVEQPTLHRILAGRVREPRISTLERLADRFGIPLAWILGELPNAELGAAPVRDELAKFVGGLTSRDLPLWWRIIALYYRRAQRDDRQAIETAKPTSDAARVLLDHYWDFRRVDRTGLLLGVCLGPIVESRRTIPADFMHDLRALFEFETRMCRRVRLSLQELR